MMNEELLCSVIAQPILHSSFIILNSSAILSGELPFRPFDSFLNSCEQISM